jgi:hypothetical protein
MSAYRLPSSHEERFPDGFQGANWTHALANAMDLSVSVWNPTQSAVDSLIEAVAPAASKETRKPENKETRK